jgi:iron-sulfur cluster assembly protein
MKLPVEISDVALVEIQSILDQKKVPEGYCLRIGSRGSGCSGVSHYLGFDLKNDDDMVFDHKELVVLIKKKDFMHLIGVKLNFVEEKEQRGFVFE